MSAVHDSTSPTTAPPSATVQPNAPVQPPSPVPAVVLLIPVLNPSVAMTALLARLHQAVRPLGIIVVDDGTGPGPDGSADVLFALLERQGAHVLRSPVNRGKGAALKTGIEAARTLFPGCGVVTVDADGQHRPLDVAAVAAALTQAQSDDPAAPALVMGVRRFGPGTPLRSRVGNHASSALLATVTGHWLHDTQTGLRGIDPHLLATAAATPGSRYEYEMRHLMTHLKRRHRLIQVPIRTVYTDDNASSHFRPVRDSLRVLAPLFAFALSSLGAAVVDTGLFLLLVASGNPLVVSLGVARAVSGALNWWINRYLVLGTGGVGWARSLLHYVMLAGGLVVGASVVLPVLSGIGMPLLAAKVLTDLLLFAVSFVIQRALARPSAQPGTPSAAEPATPSDTAPVAPSDAALAHRRASVP